MPRKLLETVISAAIGEVFEIADMQRVTGGDINEAVVVTATDGRRFFAKFNKAELLLMFSAEAEALREIQASKTIRVPAPIAEGKGDGHSVLVLEYLEFGRPTPSTFEQLGEQLAAMHRNSAAHFGWKRDNTIGSTAQINTPGNDWANFYRENRLRPQLVLTQERGAPGSLIDAGERLLASVPAFFTTYHPVPSLLHGDLWGGNWAADANGKPVIYDPALYYGDRETDLAMTELFGGFDDRFYHSYRHAWPCDPGYDTRKVLYNLYHVLNHFNLFGGSYAQQANGMIEQLISEIS